MKRSGVRIIGILFVILCAAALLGGCGGGSRQGAVAPSDYSAAKNWLNLPAAAVHSADVVYLYPTAYTRADDGDPIICAIDNAAMRAGAQKIFTQQAAVFEDSANVYAPYYRQMDAEYVLSISAEERGVIASRKPKTDVFAALDYYFENYNEGRPYILAGHSQGSNLLIYVLAEYMKRHPERYKRMIAAYVIGYSVTKDYLAQNPHLKFAEGADDTGVIVSYNTEAPVVSGDNPVLLEGGISINPISWTREETLAAAASNLGSLTKEDAAAKAGLTVETPGIADAAVDRRRGVVKCSSVDRDKYEIKVPPFGGGIYHTWDYGFYYMNLKKNAAERIAAYFNKAF
ncbi:MAG: DUF3089 domain-containing protein [bacterium]|nr:DUF3089 domain-containing protein [bacterium]